MKYKENWLATQAQYKAWWNHSRLGRPLMWVVARRKTLLEDLEPIDSPQNPKAQYLDVDRILAEKRNYFKTHLFLADSFPYVDLNLGAGSMSLYLGSMPGFAWDTIWFSECAKSIHDLKNLRYDGSNAWLKLHLEMVRKAQEASNGDFLVAIPDIVENADILSAMRGPQEFCYDLVDEPELVKQCIGRIDELYFKYYNNFYERLKGQDGSSCYTAFCIWGPGKTAKIQCDFCALMSPVQFREFIQPSLRKQCQALEHSLYHLDGPDAVKHLDALLEIEELDAVQWTPGAGRPDGGSEIWYPIYEKVRKAGKSLWIYFSDGAYEDWIGHADKLMERFGADGMYLLFPEMEEEDAFKLMEHAETHWDV